MTLPRQKALPGSDSTSQGKVREPRGREGIGGLPITIMHFTQSRLMTWGIIGIRWEHVNHCDSHMTNDSLDRLLTGQEIQDRFRREAGLSVPDGSAPPGLTDSGALAALVRLAVSSSRRRRFFLDRVCPMEDSLSPRLESTVRSASGNAMPR